MFLLGLFPLIYLSTYMTETLFKFHQDPKVVAILHHAAKAIFFAILTGHYVMWAHDYFGILYITFEA